MYHQILYKALAIVLVVTMFFCFPRFHYLCGK